MRQTPPKSGNRTDTQQPSLYAPSRLAIAIAIILVIAAFVIYFSVGLTNLHLPGPQNDEVADAVPAMELLRGLPNSAFDTIDILGHQLPLMMGHYIGPTSIYTSYVGMALFGDTIEGLRISQLVLGAFTLLLLWLAARRWFDPLSAGLAVLLCASAPAYLWWSRAGVHFSAPLLTLALIYLMLVVRHWQTRQPALLITAAFIFGLGVTTKLLFLWLAMPVVLTALIIGGLRECRSIFRSIKPGALFLAIIAGLVGLLPFILHNIPSGASFQFIAQNALQSQAYGHNNLDFIGNLRFETADFLRMIGGDTIHFGAPAGLPLSAIAVVACLVYTLAICIRYRRAIADPASSSDAIVPGHLRMRLLLVVTIVTVIPMGTVSISDIGARHLFIIAPLAWLLLAVSIMDIPMWLNRRFTVAQRTLPAIAVAALLCANHVATNIEIQYYMVASGGTGLWSDALYGLANTLETRYTGRPIMALDWGFERSIAFITHERVRMREMHEFVPVPSPRFADLATVMLRDPSNVYVFHAPDITAFKGHFEVMERQAGKAHKQLRLVQTIDERDGAPNTLIYGATDISRTFTLSPTLSNRNATLSGGLSLLGGQAAYDPTTHEVSVVLYWQNNAGSQPDDTVLVHIVDQSDGKIITTGDQQPVYGAYPFSIWQRGEVVKDPHWITLPSDLKPGIYQVRVGVYDPKTGIRRTISDPLNDAAGNSLMLHSFEIK
ncbi:MAG: glycosyltransferase family 39 protein [Chloroflexi bacterium]|nr:glycosyltransferase family 39 protein [Chloroflexota bacterium]